MELVFNRYKRNEEYIMTEYKMFKCYEVDGSKIDKYYKKGIDFKHGIPAIDYLIENFQNPDINLPREDIIHEREYFFYTIRHISQQYFPKMDGVVRIFHDPKNIYKIIKNAKGIIADPQFADEISNISGIPIKETDINKIEELILMLEAAIKDEDLIFCHFADG